MAESSAQRFRESIKILKGLLLDQQRSRDDQRASQAAANKDDDPGYLEETWKAKVLSVQVELQEEQKKRQAAEKASESLQAKISNDLEPKITGLGRQVAALEGEKESLANEMEERTAANEDSMKELQSALEKMEKERDDANAEVKRLEEELEESQNVMLDGALRERKHYKDEILSLEAVVKDVTESRDKLQLMLERKRKHVSNEEFQTILHYFQNVIESAGEAIESLESIVGDRPDGALQHAMDLKGIFEASVNDAMHFVATITSEDATAEELSRKEDDKSAHVAREPESQDFLRHEPRAINAEMVDRGVHYQETDRDDSSTTSSGRENDKSAGVAREPESQDFERHEPRTINAEMVDRGVHYQETDRDDSSTASSGREDDSVEEELSDDSERYQNRAAYARMAAKTESSDDDYPAETEVRHREETAQDYESGQYDSAQEEWMEEKPKRKTEQGHEFVVKRAKL